jgi:hypothetical protein
MATLTGSAVLESILDQTGAQPSSLFQMALAQMIQEAIDAGITSNLALTSILMVNKSIRESTPDEQNPITFLLGVVADVKQEIADRPEDAVIDVGTVFDDPVLFDADDGAYNFIDDASVETNVAINNFSANDTISFENADLSNYEFANSGEDVWLTYNYNDEGPMNFITLTGIVSSEDLVYDLDSFVAATGFDPFVV